MARAARTQEDPVPSVSVVVPVRNGELHLRHALASICGQTFDDMEIIVVDDGSTDSTPEIIAEFAAADDRIRVVPGPASGSAGAARNAGLDVATGDYLAFLDADDFFAPQLLARLIAKAESERADIAVTRFRVFDDAGHAPVSVNWGLRTEYLPTQTPFSPTSLGGALFYAFGPVAWNKLFTADLVRRHGLRFQESRRFNDLFFTFSALARAERITCVDRTLIDYRIGNPTSLQGSTHLSPLEFADALGALQDSLRSAGLYDRYKVAFANEAVEVCLSNLAKAPTLDAFVEVDAALRGGLLARFDVIGRDPHDFVTPDLFERLERYLASTREEFLFDRTRRALEQAGDARAEARAAAHELAGRPAVPVPTAVARAKTVRDATPTTGAGRDDAGLPDVSVVVPVHNSAPWLQDCIEGIRRQGRVRLEVICVDDGSTDSSAELLERAAAQDPRFRVIHQDNAGQSVARNRGLAEARGRYLCFLDSDDYWSIDALSELVATADGTDADVVLFDADTLLDPGVDQRTAATYRADFYHRSQEYAEVVTGPTMMARMKESGDYLVQPCLYLVRTDFLIGSEVLFRPGLPREDNLFTFECLLRAGRTTHRCVPLYTRRIRPGSTMTTSSRAAAARGYYVSFYEMLRLTAGLNLDDDTARGVAATAFKAFKQAKENFVRLDPEIGDQLAAIDPRPDAQALLLILQSAREDARRARRGSQRRSTPVPTAAVPSAPAVLRGARRLAGRGYRFLRRLARR